jgi:hypothetical protein
MYSFLLQDFITIRGAPSISSVTQTQEQWLDLMPFQDVTAWLEVKNFTNSGASILLAYQSAASKDESMFLPLTSALSIVGNGLTVTTVLKNRTATPLARWLRWQLSISGSPSATWDLTFRILVAANVIGRSRPGVASGMPLRRSP